MVGGRGPLDEEFVQAFMARDWSERYDAELEGDLIAQLTAHLDALLALEPPRNMELNEEAIAVANDTDYGLTASVFSANGRRAIRAARAIQAGTVTVNCYGEGDITTPFGGYKTSGFGGRDNGLHAHDQYTELKTIWVDLSDPASGDDLG